MIGRNTLNILKWTRQLSTKKDFAVQNVSVKSRGVPAAQEVEAGGSFEPMFSAWAAQQNLSQNDETKQKKTSQCC